MNDSLPATNFELPTPQGGAEGAPASPELQFVPPQPAMSSPGPASALPAPLHMPDPHPVAMPTRPVAQSAAPTPLVADDNDLIEKEWVQRAKQIVSATKDDPYTQNKELNKFKADYLKKRYDKDVKIEES